MKKFKLFKSALCIIVAFSMISGSALAIGTTTRRAGVADTADITNIAYSSSNISRDGAISSSDSSGELVYKLNDDITKAFISVSGGAEGTDFKLYSSDDGISYREKPSSAQSIGFVMKNKAQKLYSYSAFPKGQKFIKLELLNSNTSLNGVYINMDEENTPYKSIYALAFKDNSSAAANGDKLADFNKYKANMISKIQTTGDPATFINSMASNGSWSDIVYDGKTVNAAYEHCNRMNQIIKAVSSPQNKYYKNAGVIEKVVKSIDYWVNAGISFDNWYYSAIVVPEYIGESLLISKGIIPPASEQKLASYMKNKVSYIDQVAASDCGSNILHEMGAKIFYALYMDDLQMLLDCFNRVNMEIVMVDDMPEDQAFRADMWRGYITHSSLPSTIEGIQADYSCLFHGPQIYSGGYGRALLILLAPMLVDTNGTDLYPKTGLDTLVDHILEHYAYIMRGNTICYSTIGRQIATNSNLVKSGNADPVYEVIEQLLKMDNIPRKAELEAVLNAAASSTEKPYLKPTYSASSVVASAEPEDISPATNVIDGNITTRWASNNPSDVITVDLGAEKDVSTVAVSFYMGMTRKSKFDLYVSADNESWNMVASGDGTGVTDGYEYFVFAPQKVRYIKLIGYGNSSNEWNSINEISAFDKIPTEGVGAYGESYKFIDEIGESKRYILVEPEPVPNPAVTGHKYYWKADYTAHAKADYLFTVKSASNRTLGSEQISYLNRKGDFLGDGTSFIYRTGKEYDDIFVAWDWHKIPGTTIETVPFADSTDINYSTTGSESDRVGGVSDGNNGATAMELVRGNLSAKKAWFMFDNEVMALGADVRINKSKNSLYTTVNQSLLKTDAVIGTNSSTKVITPDTPEAQSASWALQDRIGYVFGENAKIRISAKEQSGDRYDIDWGGATSRPDRTNVVSKNVFKLWFDHTADNTDSYEYTIVPNVSEEEIKAYAADNPLKVISNTGALQAVENIKTGEKQAIFWKAGEVTFGDMTVSADKEVVLMLKEIDGKLNLYVASLAQKEETVNVSITRNGETKSYTIELPKERYAGSTAATVIE